MIPSTQKNPCPSDVFNQIWEIFLYFFPSAFSLISGISIRENLLNWSFDFLYFFSHFFPPLLFYFLCDFLIIFLFVIARLLFSDVTGSLSKSFSLFFDYSLSLFLFCGCNTFTSCKYEWKVFCFLQFSSVQVTQSQPLEDELLIWIFFSLRTWDKAQGSCVPEVCSSWAVSPPEASPVIFSAAHSGVRSRKSHCGLGFWLVSLIHLFTKFYWGAFRHLRVYS